MIFYLVSKNILAAIFFLIVCSRAEIFRGQDVVASNLSNKDTTPIQLVNVEGCPTEDGFLAVDQSKQLDGCAEMRCIRNDDVTLGLIFVSCPSNDLPARCKLAPSKYVEFPKCCERVVVCEKIVFDISPAVIDSHNYTLISRDEFENLVNTHKDPDHVNDVIPSSYLAYKVNSDYSGLDYDYMDAVADQSSLSDFHEMKEMSKMVQDKVLPNELKKIRSKFVTTE